MEQKEKVIQWLPAPSVPSSISRLLPDDWGAEFEVTVPDTSFAGRGFRFHFDEVLAVRPANQSFRLLLEANNALCLTFKVENSEWLKSFHEKTYGMFQGYQIQHFVFVSDATTEVLSAVEPRIEELNA